MTPAIISSLAIVVFSALIHASFQLSVSVLTLLSGHSLGKQTARRKVLRLMNGFVCGVLVLTALFYALKPRNSCFTLLQQRDRKSVL